MSQPILTDGLTTAQCLERYELQQRDQPACYRIRWTDRSGATGLGDEYKTYETCAWAVDSYNEQQMTNSMHSGVTHSVDVGRLTSRQLQVARMAWEFSLDTKVADSAAANKARSISVVSGDLDLELANYADEDAP